MNEFDQLPSNQENEQQDLVDAPQTGAGESSSQPQQDSIAESQPGADESSSQPQQDFVDAPQTGADESSSQPQQDPVPQQQAWTTAPQPQVAALPQQVWLQQFQQVQGRMPTQQEFDEAVAGGRVIPDMPTPQPLTDDQWEEQFREVHGREPSMSEYRTAIQQGEIGFPASQAAVDDATGQISEGVKQITEGTKEFFKTSVVPAALSAKDFAVKSADSFKENVGPATKKAVTSVRSSIPTANTAVQQGVASTGVKPLPIIGSVAIVLSYVIAIFGTFMPYVSITALGMSMDLSLHAELLDGLGTFLIVVFIVLLIPAAISIFLRKRALFIVSGVLSLLLGLFLLFSLLYGQAELDSIPGVPGFFESKLGAGFYVLLFASMALVGGSILSFFPLNNNVAPAPGMMPGQGMPPAPGGGAEGPMQGHVGMPPAQGAASYQGMPPTVEDAFPPTNPDGDNVAPDDMQPPASSSHEPPIPQEPDQTEE